MFRNLGKLKYKTLYKIIQIDLKNLKDDINFTEEFIIYKNKNDLSIYDRICDHNSGKLISKNNKTFCPMHNWEFLPKKRLLYKWLKKIKKILRLKMAKYLSKKVNWNLILNFLIKISMLK